MDRMQSAVESFHRKFGMVIGIRPAISRPALRCNLIREEAKETSTPSSEEKGGGATREDGKLLKPADWRPPDIQRELDRQSVGRIRLLERQREALKTCAPCSERGTAYVRQWRANQERP